MSQRRVNPDTGVIEERDDLNFFEGLVEDVFGIEMPWNPVDFDDD